MFERAPWCVAALSSMATLSACVSAAGESAELEPLPTSTEVESYVRGHWPEYAGRLVSFAPGERPTLESFRHDSCEYRNSLPDCSFYVTVRFADGSVRERQFWTQFDRDEAGNLREVIFVGH